MIFNSKNELCITIATTCPFCHLTKHADLVESHYKAWKSGTLIQVAFPELNADQREMLMTGICKSCWDAMHYANETVCGGCGYHDSLDHNNLCESCFTKNFIGEEWQGN